MTEYPRGYRRCPICQAYIGARCTSRASMIFDGRPVGPPAELDTPHKARKPRAGW